ncbi:MAG: hypothetical protein HZA46_07535 [Planctomycetales bacterium]|nr:hypothetical protein [Planctomycetales bacterium]
MIDRSGGSQGLRLRGSDDSECCSNAAPVFEPLGVNSPSREIRNECVTERVDIDNADFVINAAEEHQLISPFSLRPKQDQLLQLPCKHGHLNLREIWSALGVSKQRTFDLLRPLVETELITREGMLQVGRYVLS